MVHRASLKTVFLLVSVAISLNAGHCRAEDGTNIPVKIKESLLKHHPQATELQAQEVKHFGNSLTKVSFKEQDEINMMLFRSNGSLYSNILLVEDPTPFPSALINTLKKEFANYEFKKAELVVNPNGVGEEYDIFLVAEGANWLLSVTDKGQLLNKRNY
jgi:hypothetical protein